MKKRTYRLLIENLLNMADESQDFAAYSKGHHDPETFRREVADYVGIEPEAMDEPLHEYWRAMPVDSMAGVDYRMVVTEPGRGAFPVTVVYWP
jgi:hypothetical protein